MYDLPAGSLGGCLTTIKFCLLKKSIKIDNERSFAPENIRNNTPRIAADFLSFLFSLRIPYGLIKQNSVKRVLLSGLFLVMVFRLSAPEMKALHIFEQKNIEPFNVLIDAIGMVETRGDTLAFNPGELAAGFLQIRPVRIEDYNRRTGSQYTIDDMFSYELSRKVFLYYASQIGPYNFERITKNWNGSGPMTDLYWKQVKKYL